MAARREALRSLQSELASVKRLHEDLVACIPRLGTCAEDIQSDARKHPSKTPLSWEQTRNFDWQPLPK